MVALYCSWVICTGRGDGSLSLGCGPLWDVTDDWLFNRCIHSAS